MRRGVARKARCTHEDGVGMGHGLVSPWPYLHKDRLCCEHATDLAISPVYQISGTGLYHGLLLGLYIMV